MQVYGLQGIPVQNTVGVKHSRSMLKNIGFNFETDVTKFMH